MKLISLNIWKGKLREPLLTFLQREAPTTDIFCFQEVTEALDGSGIFLAIEKALPDFQGFFETAQDEEGNKAEGLAMFIKKNEQVEHEGDFFIYRNRDAMTDGDGRTLGKNIQFAEIAAPRRENPGGTLAKKLAVINVHGLWSGKERADSENRIAQSKKLKAFLNNLEGEKIVCGDFNLTLNTQSLAIIEAGMKNLIRESGVTSTRPEKYFPYPDKFADYILVDQEIAVRDFKVYRDEVSDHLALGVGFEV